ncbi:MAG: hypothetical protein R6U15_01815 [Candidatus Izemoplasmatales bacterium]
MNMKEENKQQDNENSPCINTRYSIRWGHTPDNLNMVFISDVVSSPQEAIDEFYECYSDVFCDHPKPYTI